MGDLRNMTAVYLFRGEKVLLLFKEGGRVVSNVWTGSAGGHFEESELNDPRACVLRELREETGLCENDIRNLTLRYITLRNTNGEIRQNYYFFADFPEADGREVHSNEGTLKWFHIDDIDGLAMPFTAKYVIAHYCREGRYTETLYAGITGENGVAFSELRE